MDAGAGLPLFDVFTRSTSELFDLERAVIDRAVEMAIVNEDCLQSMLAAIRTHEDEPIRLSWPRRQWAAIKAARWGIPALNRVELLYFSTSEPGLTALRQRVQRAIDGGWASGLWWNVRVETAARMLDQWGLTEAHVDSVRRYAIQHQEHVDRR